MRARVLALLLMTVAAGSAAAQSGHSTSVLLPSGVGAPEWRGPVADVGSLLACDLAAIGVVRLTLDTGTAYWCDGSTWAALTGGGGGAVSSVFGRTGTVVAVSGDYSADLVTIADAGAYYTGSEVEAALQEVGADPRWTDARTPTAHASTHAAAGSDPVTITEAQISDLAHTADTDDQSATEVPYTPTTGTDWLDPDPTEVGGALDDLAARPAGASPAGSGSELQRRLDGSTFAAVTGSSVSGADVALAGVLDLPYGAVGAPSVRFPNGSGIYAMASGSAVRIGLNGTDGWVYNICTGTTPCFGGIGSARPYLLNFSSTSSSPNIIPSNADTNSGLGSAGPDDIRLIAGATSGLGQTATETTLYVAQVNEPKTRTCSDSGDANPGSLVTTVSSSTYLPLTNSDADGCDVTLSETGATSGQRLEVLVRSTAGGNVAFADLSGVQEAGSGCNLQGFGVATWRYDSDRWVLVSCNPTN